MKRRTIKKQKSRLLRVTRLMFKRKFGVRSDEVGRNVGLSSARIHHQAQQEMIRELAKLHESAVNEAFILPPGVKISFLGANE